jgi:hypothetical protein
MPETMLTATKPPEAEKRAVRRYAPMGVAQVAAGAVLTVSCRKYTLPFRWKGTSIRFLKPRFVGWQHLVAGSSQAMRISTKKRGKRHGISCISEGPFTNAAEAAIASLEKNRRLWRKRFTVASLSVSALMVQAIWLRAARGDRFWILEPSHRAATRSRVLTRRQFDASLRRVFRALAADIATVDERLSESAPGD